MQTVADPSQHHALFTAIQDEQQLLQERIERTSQTLFLVAFAIIQLSLFKHAKCVRRRKGGLHAVCLQFNSFPAREYNHVCFPVKIKNTRPAV